MELVDKLNRAAEQQRGTELGGLLHWAALHIQDQQERIKTDSEQLETALKRLVSSEAAAKIVGDILYRVGAYLAEANHQISGDQFSRDMAPWINILAVNGFKPDGSVKKSRRRAREGE